MKELNQLLELVGKEYKSDSEFPMRVKPFNKATNPLISFKKIPEIWVEDIKHFMIGQACPILEDGELGIYICDLNVWIKQNLNKILRHYKIEEITND